MAKGFTLEIKGLNETIAALKAKTKNAESIIAQEIKATAFDIENDAKRAAPVDTGFLRQNIRVGVVTKTSAEVRSDASYTPFIEFGTGGYVNVPAGLESYAMQFKGKGSKLVNLPPRPFFYPAAFKHLKELLARLRKKI